MKQSASMVVPTACNSGRRITVMSANWINGEFTRELNNSGRAVADSLTTAEDLAELLITISSGKINNNQGKNRCKILQQDVSQN